MSKPTQTETPTQAATDNAASMMTAALEGRPTTNDEHLIPDARQPVAKAPEQPEQTTEQNPIAALLGAENGAEETQETAEQKTGLKPRVFDGLPEEFHEHLKNMNRKAYEVIYPLLKELLPLRDHKDKLAKLPDLEKEVGELRDHRWADHPEAYRLTDEYQETTGHLETLTNIEQHFAAQIDALAAGAKEVELLTVVDGQLVPQKTPVGPQTQRMLNAEYFAAQQRKSQLTQNLAVLKEKHAARWGTHKSTIGELEKTLFGQYTKMLEKPANEQLAKFPAYFRNTPEARLLANAIALVTLGGKAIQKMVAEKSAVAANKTAQTQAPPTRDGVQPIAGKAAAGQAFSMEEYKNLRSSGMLG